RREGRKRHDVEAIHICFVTSFLAKTERGGFVSRNDGAWRFFPRPTRTLAMLVFPNRLGADLCLSVT
ncbi:MAG: hypothetical protein OSB26_17725, partial [Woeseiaceae bacterium]|nr:hypothetical protein [Woeseiaceae bacterium]